MHIPLTLATLAFFIAAIVVLRIRWARISRKSKLLIIFISFFAVLLFPLSLATRISSTSDHLNAIIFWGFALGYIFFVMLFTLLRPLWLAAPIAMVLILPLLSSSVVLPLAAIFSRQPHSIQAIGDGLVSDLTPIDAITPGASGVEIGIYRSLSWAPFLQRKYQGGRYLNTQCNASAAYAILQPDHHSLRMVCPEAPGAPLTDRRDLIVQLFPH